MNKQITKAIIPVAGWGTRRLPITKTIEKCMLPIGDRPIVDYVIKDCIEAGITEIFLIVSSNNSQVKNYYSDNAALEEYLIAQSKADKIPLVKAPAGVKFHFIVQDVAGKYGTAIPVYMALPFIKPDESVLVLMGDDFTYSHDGFNDIKNLIKEAGDSCALLGAKIDKNQVSRYGVIEFDSNYHFKQIVEKPEVEDAPSNLINISKYVLNPVALNLIKEFSETKIEEPEYFITIPLNDYVVAGNSLKVVPANGEYLDGGTTQGWFHANQTILNQ